jgi:hypothetical protein
MTNVIPGSPPKTAIFAHWNHYSHLNPPAFEVYANQSTDGGQTWAQDPLKISPAPSALPPNLGDNLCFMGDYIGGTPAMGTNQWLPMWTDTSAQTLCQSAPHVGAQCTWNSSAGRYQCPDGQVNCLPDPNIMARAGC